MIELSNVSAHRAQRLLREWRRALFCSYVNKSSGLVEDESVIRDLAEFDAVLADLAEALKKAKQR